MSFLYGISKVIVGITIILWALLIISLIIDRRRYRNCILFAAAALSLLFTLSVVGSYTLSRIWITLLFLIMATVPAVLIRSGILAGKDGSRSSFSIVSLATGIVMLLLEIIGFIFFLTVDAGFKFVQLSSLVLFIGVTLVYFSIIFLAFMAFTGVQKILPKRTDFDYVIISGSELEEDGSVSPVLEARLQKAIELYKNDPTPPLMIAAGGRAGKDPVAEGEVMALYLREHGVSSEDIVTELLSKNTEDKIVNSKAIIEKGDRGTYTAMVTSDYNVFRSLTAARKHDLEVTGIGTPAEKGEWAPAIVKEFFRSYKEPKHLAMFVGGWALFALICLIFVI